MPRTNIALACSAPDGLDASRGILWALALSAVFWFLVLG